MSGSVMNNYTGHRYGSWTVLSFSHHDKRRTNYYWNCICDCGTNKNVNIYYLRGGKFKKCNLCRLKEMHKRNTFHNMCGTRIYETWASMLRRCYYIKHISYPWYGGAGVKVCERWHDFPSFFEDMGDCQKGKTLDRIDPDKDYEPGNVRWVEWDMQAHNRKKRKNASSQYLGVSYYSKSGKWRSQITQKGKKIHLGDFDSEFDAAIAYDNASYKLYGDRPNGV